MMFSIFFVQKSSFKRILKDKNIEVKIKDTSIIQVNIFGSSKPAIVRMIGIIATVLKVSDTLCTRPIAISSSSNPSYDWITQSKYDLQESVIFIALQFDSVNLGKQLWLYSSFWTWSISSTPYSWTLWYTPMAIKVIIIISLTVLGSNLFCSFLSPS